MVITDKSDARLQKDNVPRDSANFGAKQERPESWHETFASCCYLTARPLQGHVKPSISAASSAVDNAVDSSRSLIWSSGRSALRGDGVRYVAILGSISRSSFQ